MNIATIKVSDVKAVTNDYPTIPVGIVGATVTFEFTDPAWDGLSKTAVFRGCVTRDVLMTGNLVRIPAETVAQACPFLFVGVYGTDAADNLVIPTLWLSLGTVRDAADPSGDPGTDPDLPIWAQLQGRVEALETGAPSDPDSPGTPGRPGEDGEDGGYYTPAVTQPSSDTVEFAFSPSKPDMPAVDPVQVKLPVSQNSGGNADCPLTVVTITIDDSGEPSEPENVLVTGITLDYSTISLTEGEGMMLAASIFPANATNRNVLWKSSNTSIVTVNNGYVTAVAEGNAVITAYSAENNTIEATCTVAVAAAESGGDSGGDGGNEGTGTGEPIPFSTLTPEATGTVMAKDGTTAALSGQYYKLPYSDGMVIVTRMHSGWVGNYPPFIVKDGGVFTCPEYESTTGATDMLWTTTLTGFSNEAEVYVNVYKTNVTACYYIPGGDA